MSDHAPARHRGATVTTTPARVGEDEPSIGELITSAQRDLSTLVQQEIALAKSELKISASFGGMAIAMFATAAFLLLMAVVMFSVGLAHVIHLTGLDLAWCFLLVFLVYVLVAGLLGFIGYKKIQRVGKPERTLEQAQRTKDVLLRKS